MMRALGICALCAIALPGSAQSIEEAARANVALSSQLCMAVMVQQAVPQQAFGAAGFTYRAIDRGTNDYGVALGIDHFYDAPADTAKAEVDNPAGPNGICQVYTTKLAEPEVKALVLGTILQAYPQAQIADGPEMAVRNISQLPLLVSVRTVTQHRYEAPGTVQVSMSFPG